MCCARVRRQRRSMRPPPRRWPLAARPPSCRHWCGAEWHANIQTYIFITRGGQRRREAAALRRQQHQVCIHAAAAAQLDESKKDASSQCRARPQAFMERLLTRSFHTSATNCCFHHFPTSSLNFSCKSHNSSELLPASVGGPGSGGDGPGGCGERQPARWEAKRRSLTKDS